MPKEDCDEKMTDNLNANAVRGAINEAHSMTVEFASKHPEEENTKKLILRFTDLVMDLSVWISPLTDDKLQEKLKEIEKKVKDADPREDQE